MTHTVPMCLHMALEAGLLVEASSADVASVGLLAGVDAQVSLQMAGTHKHLTAVRAEEALLGPRPLVKGARAFSWAAAELPRQTAGAGGGTRVRQLRWHYVFVVSSVRLFRECEGAARGLGVRWDKMSSRRDRRAVLRRPIICPVT